ncbi:MAG: hypothetical protein AAFO29_12165, partial [Actinomycetota bacterium]
VVLIDDRDHLFEAKPDYVLVLPWNLMDEISAQLADISTWGGKLVRAVPSLQIVEPGTLSTP